MDFWKLPFMQCIARDENILQNLKSKSAPWIRCYCLSKERVDSESWKRVVFKTTLWLFKVSSKWNISIFIPAHLLRAQTRENLNLLSLKHGWFLWRRCCALHCEGKSVQKLPTNFILGHIAFVIADKSPSIMNAISRSLSVNYSSVY